MAKSNESDLFTKELNVNVSGIRETSRDGPGLVTEELLPSLGWKQFGESRIPRTERRECGIEQEA